ncbi:hypothetical protein TNCV_810121 [Trichonephila clavipes]|uniref:Uncharacterized protein n=1 Tax=Trichonephila clavipes TaxID=2585209 RepID=A0A8X6S831_TRICX|nr:hypothetical protein TNCV_810121 [Trichonephila clavipes]
MSPYPFSPKKSYRTTGLIAFKRSDRNTNGRRARKSTERKEDTTVLKRSSESTKLKLDGTRATARQRLFPEGWEEK